MKSSLRVRKPASTTQAAPKSMNCPRCDMIAGTCFWKNERVLTGSAMGREPIKEKHVFLSFIKTKLQYFLAKQKYIILM